VSHSEDIFHTSPVVVVIPNWNGVDLIRECLRSLRGQTLSHKVIVVDNGSVDGSNDLVRDEFPEVQLLEFPDNSGFAGGVNRGIRPALEHGAKYIVLLNNDAVADEHWLEELVAVAEADERVGIVAAKMLAMDGKEIDSTGELYSIWGFPFPRGRGEIDSGQYDSEDMGDVFAASGGASLYRARMLQEIGLFDERFFAYFEDVDISFRARLEGWEIHLACAATVRHFIGGTSSRVHNFGTDSQDSAARPGQFTKQNAFLRYHTVKNFCYLYTKNMPGYLYWTYLPRFWLSVVMMLVSDIMRGMLASNCKAGIMVTMHLPAVLIDRWKIQSRRSIGCAEIDRRLVHRLPPLQRMRLERRGRSRARTCR